MTRLGMSTTGLLALVGCATACMQHASLDARWPGPSLELSSQHVPMMKRQRQQQTVDVFFGQVQNAPVTMHACFAVNTQEQQKPQNFQTMQTIDLQKGDSNLDLGVAVYFTQDGNQAIMYDTQPVPELASTCLGMMQQQGVNVNQIVLSHKHQDHVGGLGSDALNQIPVLAQDNTLKALQQDGGRTPDETYTDFKALTIGNVNVNVSHFDAHTNDGSGLFINNAMVLMGDECEDNIPFIAEPERIQSQRDNLNQRINEIKAQGINKVCPAHGNGQTILDGCFGLDLCVSNLKYLDIMMNDLNNACDFAGGGGNGNGNAKNQAFQKLQQLAPQLDKQSGEIREAYGVAHLSNCRSLQQLEGGGRQGGRGQGNGGNGGRGQQGNGGKGRQGDGRNGGNGGNNKKQGGNGGNGRNNKNGRNN
ncbi:hypothetical protein HIM_08097 [Hirsutella minnesotensis 3608]|uniref:Metallo-beta-lactamase domain-containing protein n=1 Tax=Hirsutella minnesotensis 3608 TaxID=1043627 RepID=A0A0F7ZT65_9HYPO|nr:hypothetical protein HIM_08097 [Hirsutella minnesotensis 3608]